MEPGGFAGATCSLTQGTGARTGWPRETLESQTVAGIERRTGRS
jgi:hypothetical protein